MEKVFTVTDDGPKRGVADFGAIPHAYESLFDDSEDEWDSTFLLRPVDPVSTTLRGLTGTLIGLLMDAPAYGAAASQRHFLRYQSES